ncbi:MAG TPA: hypothetical protein VL523_16460 [Terriglobia bacterium]|nr:hypothetical protein [Terriglobia bacterium]
MGWVLMAGSAAAPVAAQAPTHVDEAVTQAYRSAEPLTSWSFPKLRRAIPELKDLQPSDDQSRLPALLRNVAANLAAFRQNIFNTSSTENIDERRTANTSHTIDELALLGSSDVPVASADEDREQFNYLVLPDAASRSGIREYRTDSGGQERNRKGPAEIFARTIGFVALPFFFAADAQRLSSFRYLGSQALNGRATEVVAFAEHVEADAVRGQWVSGAISVPLLLQGVAWIDPVTWEILRLRTDLLAPQPVAGLRRLTTVAVYAEVRFQNRPLAYCLPQEVQVVLDAGGYTFINRHRYSNYQVFNVQTQQKVEAPKQAPQPPKP